MTRAKPSITIDKELFEKYKLVLAKFGMKFSTRIEQLMIEDIERLRNRRF